MSLCRLHPSTGSEPAPYSIRGRTDDDHHPLYSHSLGPSPHIRQELPVQRQRLRHPLIQRRDRQPHVGRARGSRHKVAAKQRQVKRILHLPGVFGIVRVVAAGDGKAVRRPATSAPPPRAAPNRPETPPARRIRAVAGNCAVGCPSSLRSQRPSTQRRAAWASRVYTSPMPLKTGFFLRRDEFHFIGLFRIAFRRQVDMRQQGADRSSLTRKIS